MTNKYTEMQKRAYENGADYMRQTGQHKEHNDNPDYWEHLINEIFRHFYYMKRPIVVMDFGCGQGRNIQNLISKAKEAETDEKKVFSALYGIDISQRNTDFAKANLGIEYTSHGIRWEHPITKEEIQEPPFVTFLANNGTDLDIIPEPEIFDAVMSTIVFQHICVHEIRYQLMEDIYRILKPGGIFVFQMGTGKNESTPPEFCSYYDNNYDAQHTNGSMDTLVEDPEYLAKDLEKIGFVNVKYHIAPPWTDRHPNWIFVKCVKPSM